MADVRHKVKRAKGQSEEKREVHETSVGEHERNKREESVKERSERDRRVCWCWSSLVGIAACAASYE